MIQHIVLFAFKPELTEGQIALFFNHLKSLATSLSVIKSFTFGANCSAENLHRGFTHGFTMIFKDKEGRDIYLNHKDHKQIIEKIIVPALKEGRNSILVFDYEI